MQSRGAKRRGTLETVMSKWYLYIARCKDGTFYTGITTNLESRLKRHNLGKASRYTRTRRPLKIVYAKKFENRISAAKEEFEIKKLSHSNKEELIKA